MLALGLPGFCVFLYTVRAFQAMQDLRTAFWLYVVENGVNVALAIVLVGPTRSPRRRAFDKRRLHDRRVSWRCSCSGPASGGLDWAVVARPFGRVLSPPSLSSLPRRSAPTFRLPRARSAWPSA